MVEIKAGICNMCGAGCPGHVVLFDGVMICAFCELDTNKYTDIKPAKIRLTKFEVPEYLRGRISEVYEMPTLREEH